MISNGSPVVGAGPVPSSASGHGQEDHISILCRGAIYREGDHGSDTIPDNETVLDVVDFSLENTLGDSITHYAVSCSLLEPRHCPPENARPLGVDDPGGTDWSWTGIFQRGPKRKQVYIWTCVSCLESLVAEQYSPVANVVPLRANWQRYPS